MIISDTDKVTMLENVIQRLLLARVAVDAYAGAIGAVARKYPGELEDVSKTIRYASEHVADVMFAIKGEIEKESAHDRV